MGRARGRRGAAPGELGHAVRSARRPDRAGAAAILAAHGRHRTKSTTTASAAADDERGTRGRARTPGTASAGIPPHPRHAAKKAREDPGPARSAPGAGRPARRHPGEIDLEALRAALKASIADHHPTADLSGVDRAFDLAVEAHEGQHAPPASRTSPTRSPRPRSWPTSASTRRRRGGAPPRRPRGHRVQPHRHRGAVRRRGRPPRRRRDQAVALLDPQPRAAAGREHPEDAAGDGGGHPRRPHQARRPAAQHAHAVRPAVREAAAHRPPDHGDLRAARRAARDLADQVGARGPRVQGPRARALPRARQAARHAAQGPRVVHRPRDRRAPAAARGRRHRGRPAGPPEAHLQHLEEDAAQGRGVRRDLRRLRHPRARRRGPRLLRGARHRPQPVAPDPRPVRRLHRRPQEQPLPVAPHRGHRARRQAARDPDPDAPRCTRSPRSASPRTGATRKARRPTASTTPSSPGCASSWTGSATSPSRTRPSSSRASSSTSSRTRSSCSRRRATSRTCRPGATPLDFAYRIHTDVGHRTIGAKVNNRLVPLDYRLKNGDIVEIVTTKGEHGPSRDWLNVVRTSHAREKIRQWFKRKDRDENIVHGSESLERELRRLARTTIAAVGHDKIAEVARAAQLRLGRRLLRGDRLRRDRRPGGGHAPRRRRRRAEPAPDGRAAAAASPAPAASGSRASATCSSASRSAATRSRATRSSGFITRGKGVTVHLRSCPTVVNEREVSRLIEVEWEAAPDPDLPDRDPRRGVRPDRPPQRHHPGRRREQGQHRRRERRRRARTTRRS